MRGYDYYCSDRPHHGGSRSSRARRSFLRLSLPEHKYCNCCSVSAHFCRSARWRPSFLKVDWQSQLRWPAPERRDGHVHFGAAILCTILPSQVAFTSLISAGGVPTIASYCLISLLRLTMTPNHFKASHFYLGRFRKPFYLAAAVFNALIVCVMLSPFFFPVDAENFNFVSLNLRPLLRLSLAGCIWTGLLIFCLLFFLYYYRHAQFSALRRYSAF